MSDAQKQHVFTIERRVPRLAALKIELCLGQMSEGCFWKIYFVLLHSILGKHDAELLSTPQIVEARALLLEELQKLTKLEYFSPSVYLDPKIHPVVHIDLADLFLLGHEDDSSFGDLEEDDDERSAWTIVIPKTEKDVHDSSTKDSAGWVQLVRN